MINKLRTIYLAMPLMLGITACAPAQTFVFVNSPKDLEYKLGNHEPAIQRNVNRGIDNSRKGYLVMHGRDFNGERRDYRLDKMPEMNDMQRNGMHGMRRGMYGRMPGMNRMPNMYRGHGSDSSMFRPYMKNDTARYNMMRNNNYNNVMRNDMMHRK